MASVAYGYKDIYQSKVPSGNFGVSGSCNINVLCPAGNGWESERNSVALILGGAGTAVCTGAMINNTGNLTIPYFLTANHCFDGAEANWKFFFHAWSPSCTPSQNADGILFNGSYLRARHDATDFMLLELKDLPPANSSIYAAGWSRSTFGAGSGVGIHHPSGDVMKISTYNSGVLRADNFFPPTVPGTKHWIVEWSQGVTEGGSSGSPLFGEDHRIVGQLAGGPSHCGSNDQRDAYGRFDDSWLGGGTSSTRLSTWLNPARSASLTTDAILLCAPSASNSTLIYPSGQRGVNPVTLCAGCSYNFLVDYVVGATSYTWLLPPGFSFLSGQNTSTPAILTSTTPGTYTLYCSANNACGSSYTHSLTINIGGGGPQQRVRSGDGPTPHNSISDNSEFYKIYPNPTSKTLIIEWDGKDLNLEPADNPSQGNEEFNIRLVNSLSMEISSGASKNGKITLDVSAIQSGLYYLFILRGQEFIVEKVMISR